MRPAGESQLEVRKVHRGPATPGMKAISEHYRRLAFFLLLPSFNPVETTPGVPKTGGTLILANAH